jgi:hypothetical protein
MSRVVVGGDGPGWFSVRIDALGDAERTADERCTENEASGDHRGWDPGRSPARLTTRR